MIVLPISAFTASPEKADEIHGRYHKKPVSHVDGKKC